MDDIVKAALKKWPNVPHCYGWLALDARAQWRMRDDACQRLGLPGDVIRHPALIEFIQRNYLSDQHGCWYFQNGPQRVYVNLQRTPYIVQTADRINPAHQAQCPTGLRFHTGEALQQITHFYIDQAGNLMLQADGKLAQIDDRDLATCLQNLQLNGQPADEEDLYEIISMPNVNETTSTALQLCLQIAPHTPLCAPLQRKELATLMQEYGFQATPCAI